MGVRRNIALWICPDLNPARWVPALGSGADRSAASSENALHVKALDQVLTAYHGKALVWRDIKPAIGAPADVGTVGETDAYQAIQTIRKLRPGAVPSCGEKAWFRAICLFDHVWPNDLEWPAPIPRLRLTGEVYEGGKITCPKPTKKEAA